MKNTFIYLIGFPGTGKYTIGKIIAAKTGARLVDNHLINNPVFSLIHADGKNKLPPTVWDHVSRIWRVVLDTIETLSPPDYSFILTNALFEESAGDMEHYNNIKTVADKRGAHFVPVRLLITDVEEHARRIVSHDRALRHKETNPESPAVYAATKDVMRIEHKNLLTLDISALAPEAAAETVIEHALKR